mmetsp:Transcript_18996/g.28697  ORF Transcript_18996/g.28697 Transcript_18996/m.28697 type:complete len:708 (+) Transcript_18996:57-2180(+)
MRPSASSQHSGSGIKWVAVVGSSGGSAVLMSSPWEVLTALKEQLSGINDKIPPRIGAAQFVCCEKALDTAGPRSMAALWLMDAQRPGYELEPQCILRGELYVVNARARELDGRLAQSGIMDTMDAVVALSADSRPGGANEQVLRAAARRGLPVAGTGGSSLSRAASVYGCQLAGNSGGSVAVNTSTKAISVAASLASAWNLSYSPRRFIAPIPLQTIIADAVPALIALALIRRFLELIFLLLNNSTQTSYFASAKYFSDDNIINSFTSSILSSQTGRTKHQFDTDQEKQFFFYSSLPLLFQFIVTGLVAAPAVGAIAAGRRSQLGSLAYIGGAIIGGLCRGSSSTALFLAGIIFPQLAPTCLAICARQAIPATASTLLIAGCLPILLALGARLFAFDLITIYATSFIRRCIATVTSSSILAPLVGIAMSYGCREKGWYHAYFLPLIALEHEHGQLSTLGTLDCLCLCVTGAGVNAAQVLLPRRVTTSAYLSGKGGRIKRAMVSEKLVPPSTTNTMNMHQQQYTSGSNLEPLASITNDNTRRHIDWLSPPQVTNDHLQPADGLRTSGISINNPSVGGNLGGTISLEQAHPTNARLWPAPEQRATADLARLELARRGFAINIGCGDYIEACHPFLLADPALDLATYFACALAAILCVGARSSAYLPLPISIIIADQPMRLAQAALVAFLLPCIAGLISNAVWKHYHRFD